MSLNGLTHFDEAKSDGFIRDFSISFNKGCEHLRDNMMKAKEALTGDGSAKKGDPGSPGLLAEFQVASSEYQLYRTAQTSFIKSITDLNKGILQKW